MKTPDEIKNMLKKCPNADCSLCQSRFHCDLEAEALEYIQQLENQIGVLTEKVSQLEAAQPKWISVEERLPNAGEKVMIRGVKNGMQIGAFRGLSHPGNNRKWNWKKNTILEVTPWMPIPSTEGLE